MDRAGGVLHQKVNKRPHSLAGGLESTVAGERQTPHGGSDRLDRKSAVSRAWRDYEVEDIRQTTRRLALAQTLAATNRRWPSQRAGISYRPARLAGHAAVGPAVKHPLMIGARPGRANGHHRCLSIVNRPFRALGGITRIFVKQETTRRRAMANAGWSRLGFGLRMCENLPYIGSILREFEMIPYYGHTYA